RRAPAAAPSSPPAARAMKAISRRCARPASPARSSRARCTTAACRGRCFSASSTGESGGGRRPPPAGSGGEGMLRGRPLLQHLAGRRLAGDGALQGELRRLIVELLDLLVVGRLPMDEDADRDEEVV